MELTGLDMLPRPVRDGVRDFAQWAVARTGANALGLAVFGRVCTTDFDASRELVDSVLVLGKIDLAELRSMAPDGSRFARQRLNAPLVMTPGFIKASLDSYPLELLEIQQQHVVLLGDIHLAAATFADDHVRLECERELKSMAIGMRQGVLRTSGDEREFLPVVERTAAGLLRVVRGLYWLKADRKPQPWSVMMPEIERQAGQPLPGIRRALSEPTACDWQELCDLYHDVETLGHFTDAW
jgi:hypothetical protein